LIILLGGTTAYTYHQLPSPPDGAKAILYWADKKALMLYNWLKGVLGIDDKFIDKVLTFFGGKR